MDRIRIVGGKPLNGTIPVSGAKNATLPLMIASMLTDDVLVLENVPRLADVTQLQHILSNHGVDQSVDGKRAGRREYADEVAVADTSTARQGFFVSARRAEKIAYDELLKLATQSRRSRSE